MAVMNKAELALQLGRSMTEMRNQVNYFIQGKLREYDQEISVEMVEIMACLWKKDGINQQEIAMITIKDKSSITHLIHQLVKKSLVTRVADEHDRRNRLIYLTPAGWQLRERLYPSVLEIYDEAVKDIRYEEIERCLELVRRMNEQLQVKR